MKFDVSIFLDTMIISNILCIQISIDAIVLYILVMEWTYVCRRKTRKEYKAEKKMNTLLTVATNCGFLGAISDSIRIYCRDNKLSSPGQIALHAVASFFVSTCMLLIYSILWMRQRALYTNPALHHLTNNVTRSISKYSIYVILIVGSIATIMFCSVAVFKYCTNCERVFRYVTQLILPCVTQLTLFSLFAHPLVKNLKCNSVTDKKYVSVLKRISVITAICLAIDISLVPLGVCVNFDLTRPLYVISNLSSVMLTMSDWRIHLFPCCPGTSETNTSPKAAVIHINSGYCQDEF